jgi:arsenate reductase
MKPSILILSDRNETRGPMLEGWIKYYAKDNADVLSAGIDTSKLNLIAAKAMMEAVIDITKHKPTPIEKHTRNSFDWIITLTESAKVKAEEQFEGIKMIHKTVEHPLNDRDEDLEKLKKHRKTVNELEEFAIEFVHANIRKLL